MTLQTILILSFMLPFYWRGFLGLLLLAIRKEAEKIKNFENKLQS